MNAIQLYELHQTCIFLKTPKQQCGEESEWEQKRGRGPPDRYVAAAAYLIAPEGSFTLKVELSNHQRVFQATL